MTYDEIKQFENFMQHSEVKKLYHEGRKIAELYAKNFIEQKSAELEITCDYYIMEFM